MYLRCDCEIFVASIDIYGDLSVEGDGILEPEDVRVDVSIEQFGVRPDKAHSEGREASLLAHAADVEKNLAHFLQHILGRKFLAFFHFRDDLIITVVNGIDER